MKAESAADRDAALRNLTPIGASQLLLLARTEARRPIDEVLDRIAEDDGETWFHTAVETCLCNGAPQRGAELLRGEVPPHELSALSRRAKSMAHNADEREPWLAGVLCYFLIIAGGLIHDGEMRSSRDPQEVREALLDLAGAAPPGWAEMLTQAATAVGSVP